MKAFITGITGQDGAYLSKLLLEKGYEVYGGIRRSASGSLWRLERLGIKDRVKLLDFELTDRSNVWQVIKEFQFDEIYNLAAQSFVASSFKTPISTSEVDGLAVANLWETVRQVSPKSKCYQASTSEMFGKVQEVPQNESTPFHPRSPYGVSKLFAHWWGVNYRESYGMFICNGILFNHESPLRGNEFVTKKITNYFKKKDFSKPLLLGNLYSQRDWGHAEDYVEAMWLMLQQEKADDYVIATGQTYSVKDFVEKTVKESGLYNQHWYGDGVDEYSTIDIFPYAVGSFHKVIEVSKDLYRPAEVDLLKGDSSKARKVLGWKPKHDLDSLIKDMLNGD